MDRKVIFKDTVTQEELILPVTPSVIEAETGVSIEVINISQLGDVTLPGNKTMSSPQIDCLFPAQHYPFCSTAPLAPYMYVEKFQKWINSGRVLRYIWSGTLINIPVLIESIRFREDDGTNDISAIISMREYQNVSTELERSAAAEPERTDDPASPSEQSYTIKWGDTLWGICRTYYGDPLLYPQVAQYNNIKNPNLISIGTTLKLPSKSVLNAMKGGAK